MSQQGIVLGRIVTGFKLPERGDRMAGKKRTPAPVGKVATKLRGVPLDRCGCRFPMWADDELPTGLYCGKKTTVGRVYCATHWAVTHQKTTWPMPQTDSTVTTAAKGQPVSDPIPGMGSTSPPSSTS